VKKEVFFSFFPSGRPSSAGSPGAAKSPPAKTAANATTASGRLIQSFLVAANRTCLSSRIYRESDQRKFGKSGLSSIPLCLPMITSHSGHRKRLIQD
jgi:hypothetical protein